MRILDPEKCLPSVEAMKDFCTKFENDRVDFEKGKFTEEDIKRILKPFNEDDNALKLDSVSATLGLLFEIFQAFQDRLNTDIKIIKSQLEKGRNAPREQREITPREQREIAEQKRHGKHSK